jgi:hypothetical protein
MSLSIERIEIFLLIYASLVVCTVTALSSLMISQIDVYVAAFIIEYFIAILATAPHYPIETKRERIIGVMLLIVFSEILIQHVIALLR